MVRLRQQAGGMYNAEDCAQAEEEAQPIFVPIALTQLEIGLGVDLRRGQGGSQKGRGTGM